MQLLKLLTVIGILGLFLTACQAEVTPAPAPTDLSPQATATPAPAPTSSAQSTPAAGQPSPAKPAGSSLGVKPAELRGLKVRFWYAASGELAKETSALIEAFNHENIWGISAEGKAFLSYTALEEQALAAVKNGDLPQLIAAPLEISLSWQRKDARASGVTPGPGPELVALDVYVRDAEWGLSQAEIADFWPSAWQAGQVSGQRWGIPAELDAQVLFYNQSWAEQLGFRQPPASSADFRTQACAAMKANVADDNLENDGTGGWMMSTDAMALENWRRAFGGEPLPADNGQAYTFNTANSVKAFSYLRKLLDQNCAWKAKSTSPFTYFAQRQALFYSGSLSDLAKQQRAMNFQKSADHWTVLTYPVDQGKPVVLTSGASYSIIKSSPAAQLATWLLLRSLMLPRAQARLAEAAGLLPARASALAAMEEYRAGHPQWAQAASWKDYLQSAPQLGSWRTTRRLLEDAAWQIFQPFTKAEGIGSVLAELDGAAKELAK